MNEKVSSKPLLVNIVKYTVCVLLLSVTIFIIDYTFSKAKRMEEFFLHGSYYVILSIVVIWVMACIGFLKARDFNLWSHLKKHKVGIFISLCLTVCVFSSVKVYFKFLSDETNLLSISKSMHEMKQCRNILQAKNVFGKTRIIKWSKTKRPLVFPFLVSVLHGLLGFRNFNPFVLNFLLMWAFLFHLFRIVKAKLGFWSGLSSILLILSCPVIPIVATSAGFDFFHNVFFCFSLYVTYLFTKYKDNATFVFLWATMVVLSNIRYESVLCFIVVFSLLIIMKFIRWSHIRDNVLLISSTPMLFLPYIWQRFMTISSSLPDEGKLFSWGHFKNHFLIFLKAMFKFDFDLPYNSILMVLSFAVCFYLIFKLFKKGVKFNNHRSCFLVILVVVCSIFVGLYFAYFYGNCLKPFAMRRFLLISILSAFSPLIMRTYVPNLMTDKRLIVFSLLMFLLYFPVASNGDKVEHLYLTRRTDFCFKLIRRHAKDNNIMVIANRTGQYAAMGYGSVSFNYANQSRTIPIEFTKHLYSTIFVIQRIQTDSLVPLEDDLLDPKYKLEVLDEIQHRSECFIRISKVVSLEE